jgi:hypothetical protein
VVAIGDATEAVSAATTVKDGLALRLTSAVRLIHRGQDLPCPSKI